MSTFDGNEQSESNPVLSVQVQRTLPTGLLVDLGNGTNGLVRTREIAWDIEVRRSWQKHFRPGQVVSAVIIKREEGRLTELSLRLAQADPWLGIEKRYALEVPVEGIVTGVMPYGVFIELEPGVSGLLHRSRLPDWLDARPSEFFWPGDHVKTIITGIDVDARRIRLSMNEIAKYRWQIQDEDDARGSQSHRQEHRHSLRRLLPLEGVALYGIKRVLVVDDDAHVRREIAGWLRNAGHAVLEGYDKVTALNILEEAFPEVVLLDLELRNQSGAEIAHQIHEQWPEVHCVIMTGNCEALQDNQTVQMLLDSGTPILCKPFHLDELLPHLYQPARGRPESQPNKLDSSFSQAASYRELGEPNRMQLTKLMADLRNATQANAVILFEFNPINRQVSYVEQVGQPKLKTKSLSQLLHSPVRDVAESRQTVRALDLHDATSPRFRHLFDLIPFDSCLGAPVPADIARQYTLFVFFGRAPLADIEEIADAYTTATAAQIGAWLERTQFRAQIAELHRVLSFGQLARSLIHEINNQRQALPKAVAMLRADHQSILQHAQHEPGLVTAEIDATEEILLALDKSISQLLDSTAPFMFLMRQGHNDEFMLLHELIHAAVDILQDMANRTNVSLFVGDLAPYCYMRAPSATVQQVLINILVNSIQKIEITRGRLGGRISIGLTPITLKNRLFYRIRIEDDGLGIHRRLWERIFEMGYTERVDGSGMGLFISRNLIERLGGKISVAASNRGWGSTFVVDLPKNE